MTSLVTRPGVQLDSVQHAAYDTVPLPLAVRKQLAAPTKQIRYIPTTAYKVLDAPGLEVPLTPLLTVIFAHALEYRTISI